jgi:hypothetical protein
MLLTGGLSGGGRGGGGSGKGGDSTAVDDHDNNDDDLEQHIPSTMMITFRVALGSAIYPRRIVTFRVVAPSGKNWNQPSKH